MLRLVTSLLPAFVLLVAAVAIGTMAGTSSVTLHPNDLWGHESFYPSETDGRVGFRWSRPRAVVHFRDIDRSRGVRIELDVRGWRPPNIPPPRLIIEIDQREIWNRDMEGDWETVKIGTGPEAGDHLDLLLDSDSFQPSAHLEASDDRRVLGLQLREVRLEVPTRRSLWITLSVAAAGVSWLILGLARVTTPVRFCWSLAAVTATQWIGLHAARPYVFDALPAWSIPFLRIFVLGLTIAPPLLAPRLTARGCTLPRWAIALTLAGSIFTVYATALQSGFFWDDFDFARPITLSEWLFTFRGTWNWTGIGNDYYRPLIVTLFQIDYHLYGLRPAGFHLTNILLHILNSTLVAWFLARWVRKRWALAGAVFFALHPMAATGLAWISERTDVLATTFFLLALLAMSRYLRPGESSGLAPVGAAYAGALASKEVAITFPAVALAYAACRQRFNRKCIRMIMFLAGMSAIYAIGWVVLFHEKLGAVNITTVASESSFIQFWHSLLRLLTFAFIPTYYPSYDFEFLGGESLTYLYVGSAFFVALGLALFVRGRAREKWLFVLASVWLVATVIPLFNIRYPDYMRLGYLPAVASGLAAAAVFAFASRYWNRAGKWLAVLLLLISVARMAPADQRIIEDWAHWGRIAQMINRDRATDQKWLERIGPERRAIFWAQLERQRVEKEHVEQIITLGATGKSP